MFEEVIDVWVKLLGVWFLTDGIFSLMLWTKDKRQSWLRDHSIRIVRIVFGVLLILFG